jgi:hypothetical protein
MIVEASTADKVSATFPPGIALPAALRHMFDWVDAYSPNDWFSGDFQSHIASDTLIQNWFGSDRAKPYLGIFGRLPDDSLFAVWKTEHNELPIILLSSDSAEGLVLATDAVQFVRLLMIGYDDQDDDDRTNVSPAFCQWAIDSLNIEAPVSQEEIVTAAQAKHPKFCPEWITSMNDYR